MKRTLGSICPKRSSTPWMPKSGEHEDQAAPMLAAGMVVGLTISILQSVTQIQEITLTFVPKIVVVMVAFVIFLPWMVSRVMGFVQPLFGGFADLVR